MYSRSLPVKPDSSYIQGLLKIQLKYHLIEYYCRRLVFKKHLFSHFFLEFFSIEFCIFPPCKCYSKTILLRCYSYYIDISGSDFALFILIKITTIFLKLERISLKITWLTKNISIKISNWNFDLNLR